MNNHKMFIFLFVFIFSVSGLVLRVPIPEKGDRTDVLNLYGLQGQRYIQDEKGHAYLAVAEDISGCEKCEIYQPRIDFGDCSCVQVETLTVIERTGYWKRRALGKFTAEIREVQPESEGRERLLRLPNIVTIHPCTEKKTQRGFFDHPFPIQQTHTIGQLQKWSEANNLTGNDITVVLVDTGITFSHIQFGFQKRQPFVSTFENPLVPIRSQNDRVVAILIRNVLGHPENYATKCGILDLHGHGTHCSGILAGERGSTGLAGKSKIIMVNNSILGSQLNETCETMSGLSGMSYWDLTNIMQAGYSPAVISNSWGAGITNPNFYAAENADYDAFVYENPSVMMLFAAGNEGQEGFSLQALARNILSVGSTTDHKTMSDFSSAGPTIDREGHMTVHVVTNGEGVNSADAFSSIGYTIKSGTSMATPLAAGIATLLREWLIRTKNPNAYSGSLLRTLLIHCAVPLADVDRSAQGFGFLQPALITDYGSEYLMQDFLLNANNDVIQVYQRIAEKSEIFRASVGWYTTPGYFLENVGGISCLKNQDYYNKTDTMNTLSQMTLHLEKGDQITCWLYFVRTHDRNVGFNLSIVIGVWPTYLLYIPEDTNITKKGEVLMSFVRLGYGPGNNFMSGTPLISGSWPCRSLFRYIMLTEPIWFIIFATIVMFFGIIFYYLIYLPDEVFISYQKRK